MNFGCHLPVYGPAATREVLLGFARRMEALGYDSLWASDHVVIPYSIASRYPYSPTGDFRWRPPPASSSRWWRSAWSPA
jgi:alkanesulfonate monooxygenase SsuD/methylene tetrahydromethanopterin reductase-like flavin-dependent oxidoreductase (luciferase family)